MPKRTLYSYMAAIFGLGVLSIALANFIFGRIGKDAAHWQTVGTDVLQDVGIAFLVAVVVGKMVDISHDLHRQDVDRALISRISLGVFTGLLGDKYPKSIKDELLQVVQKQEFMRRELRYSLSITAVPETVKESVAKHLNLVKLDDFNWSEWVLFHIISTQIVERLTDGVNRFRYRPVFDNIASFSYYVPEPTQLEVDGVRVGHDFVQTSADNKLSYSLLVTDRKYRDRGDKGTKANGLSVTVGGDPVTIRWVFQCLKRKHDREFFYTVTPVDKEYVAIDVDKNLDLAIEVVPVTSGDIIKRKVDHPAKTTYEVDLPPGLLTYQGFEVMWYVDKSVSDT